MLAQESGKRKGRPLVILIGLALIFLAVGCAYIGPDGTPAILPPDAVTSAATNVASFSATLNGSVCPNGRYTWEYFQFGRTTGYEWGSTAPWYRTGNTYQSVSANKHWLSASTTYHFRTVATNGVGTSYGSDRTITTLPATGFPFVITNPATSIMSHSARLNGTVNPHGWSTTVYLEYGTTISYGSRTLDKTKTGNNYQNVFENISGLIAGTTYHFRIVGTNTVGTRNGTDKTFTTH
jgi:hypothetical protein